MLTQFRERYIILAGPQAAGKSTAKASISSYSPSVVVLEESRQIVVHRHKRKGAIFMTKNDEIEVIHEDMQRMFRILDGDPRASLIDETNIFTLGHALARGIDLVDGYFKQYMDMLIRLRAAVLFIDVPPDVSWDRRKAHYMNRVKEYPLAEQQELLEKYKGYLDRLYPRLIEMYQKLDLPKERVEGRASLAAVSVAIIEAFRTLMKS